MHAHGFMYDFEIINFDCLSTLYLLLFRLSKSCTMHGTHHTPRDLMLLLERLTVFCCRMIVLFMPFTTIFLFFFFHSLYSCVCLFFVDFVLFLLPVCARGCSIGTILTVCVILLFLMCIHHRMCSAFSLSWLRRSA